MTKYRNSFSAIFLEFLNNIESRLSVSYFSFYKSIVSFVENEELNN